MRIIFQFCLFIILTLIPDQWQSIFFLFSNFECTTCFKLNQIIIIILLLSFSHQYKLIVFHWSLSDSKSPQVSRTLLSILANLNNGVVWMVSACLSISNSSSLFTKLLGIIPSAHFTIDIPVTLFSSLARCKYLCLFSFSLIFTLWLAEMAKSTNQQVLFFFFFLSMTWSGLLAGIRLSVFILKSQRLLCFSFSGI